MKERLSQQPETTEQKQARLAKKAANIMIGASRQEPASVTRQAATIALICHREGVETPTELKEALLSDDTQIDYVSERAKAAHEKQSKRIPEISRKKTISIIDGDYQWAEMLFNIPPEEIKKVLEYTPPGENESLRKIYADNLIRDYSRRRLMRL